MAKKINRRRVMGSEVLPYDAKIEYLEGTSLSYIDTGVSNIDAIEIKFMTTNFVSYGALFGNYESERHNVWRLIMSSDPLSESLGFYVNSKASAGWNSVPIGQRNVIHTLYMSRSVVKYDGEDFTEAISAPQGTSNHTNIALFANGTSNPTYANIGMRCYYFTMMKNGVAVRDFVPVRVGQDGYMYDRVSRQLFGNSGTGNFNLGPDK